MIDVIKDYLISVGMQVDKQTFSQANKAINEVDKGLGKFADSATGKFIKVGAGATALALAVVGAMAKFASSVAEADRQVGLLAKRLYTTKENARSLQTAMKMMKVSSLEQLRELALDPESKQQFLELKNLARSLENPKTQQAMKEIRQLNHEWNKLMVRFEYFKIEVASKILEIFKEMKPTMQKIIDWFKPIISSLTDLKNDYQGAIPNIIKGIRYLWQLLKPIINIIRGVIIFAVKGWGMIFKGIKEMPTAFKTAFQIIKTVLDPIIKIFEFLEDLIVYLAGGKSHYEKYYDKLSWLRNIRENTQSGEKTENQLIEENKKLAREATKGIKFKNEKRNYVWGANVNGFRAGRVDKYGNISKEGLNLSESNLLYTKELSDALGGVANKFMITSGWEGGHSPNSLHKYGRAMDFGFAGTQLQDQLKLIKAVLNTASTTKAWLEVDEATKNEIFKQLKSEGYNVGDKSVNGKLYWKNTPAGSNHLHTENDDARNVLTNMVSRNHPQNVTYNYNISTPDPEQVIIEAERRRNVDLKGVLVP